MEIYVEICRLLGMWIEERDVSLINVYHTAYNVVFERSPAHELSLFYQRTEAYKDIRERQRTNGVRRG